MNVCMFRLIQTPGLLTSTQRLPVNVYFRRHSHFQRYHYLDAEKKLPRIVK